MYIITCPNCGSQEIKEIEYQQFECGCGECFNISKASYDAD